MKNPRFYTDSSAFSEDIQTLTESSMTPEISDSEVVSNNFNAYWTDRSSRRGNGVRIPVTSTVTSEKTYFLNPNNIEIVGIKDSLQSFSIFVTRS